MKLDGLLCAHSFMAIERPPLLWEADTVDVRLVPLLGEMIVVGLRRGNELTQLTLNASNVTVGEDGPPGVAPGDYVALTVKGSGDWRPEWVWPPGTDAGDKVYGYVQGRLANSGAVNAYARAFKEWGSLTVFFRRAVS
jgi:hypothetical protein